MADIMHAGEFSRTNMGDLISLSVHSLNPMGTLHHESLHAFFQQLRDKGLPEIANVVERMANSPMVMKQLRDRLAHSPEALKQLRDPEERAAYAYQFWAMDKTFKLVGEPRGVFEKVKAFFQKLMGIWTNDERAEHILKYFNSGEYAKNMNSQHALHDAMLNTGKSHAWETMKHIGKPLMELNDALLSGGGERLRDSGIPALERLADRVKAKLTDSRADAGYIPAARVARGDWVNKLTVPEGVTPARRFKRRGKHGCAARSRQAPRPSWRTHDDQVLQGDARGLPDPGGGEHRRPWTGLRAPCVR